MEIEQPCALLAGMGGQTALNIASELAHSGVLDELGVELIGSDLGRNRQGGGQGFIQQGVPIYQFTNK